MLQIKIEMFKLEPWGPFLEKHGNFSGTKASFKLQTCWVVAQFLGSAHKPVNFASLTDNFTDWFVS